MGDYATLIVVMLLLLFAAVGALLWLSFDPDEGWEG